ncbi:hypothetical protein HKBW3S34_02212, partial [Candidatus Hakubella thermalkaliphila]
MSGARERMINWAEKIGPEVKRMIVK